MPQPSLQPSGATPPRPRSPRAVLEQAEAQCVRQPCRPELRRVLRQLFDFVDVVPQTAELRDLVCPFEANPARNSRRWVALVAGGLDALDLVAGRGSTRLPRAVYDAFAALPAVAHAAFAADYPMAGALQSYVAHVARGGAMGLGHEDAPSKQRLALVLVPMLAAFASAGYPGLLRCVALLRAEGVVPIDRALLQLPPLDPMTRDAPGDALEQPSGARPVGPVVAQPQPLAPRPSPPRAAPPVAAPVPPIRDVADAPAPCRVAGSIDGVALVAEMPLWRQLFGGPVAASDAAAMRDVAIEQVEVSAGAPLLLALVRALGRPERAAKAGAPQAFVGRMGGLELRASLEAASALLRPPEGAEPIAVQLQGIALRAAPGHLRTLLAPPASGTKDAPFLGEAAGRTLRCEPQALRAVLASAGSRPPAPVALQLGADALVAPSDQLRRALQRLSAEVAP